MAKKTNKELLERGIKKAENHIETKDLNTLAILTPKEQLNKLTAEFGSLYDPAPYPRPKEFNGLTAEWGKVTYCNPPFWSGHSITTWVRKAIYEKEKGKRIIMALPVDNWVAMLIENSQDIRVMRNWKWETPLGEVRNPARPLVLWVL